MSFSRRRLLAIVAVTGALSACGFRPLYRDVPGQTDVVDEFRSIDIDQVRADDEDFTERAGQQLRNELSGLLQPRGRVADPVYTLMITVGESTSELAVRKSAFATRANLQLTAKMQLYDRRRNEVVLNSPLRVVSGYNILQSEYGTLIAEEDARQKAIRSLSQEIRLRLGSFLNKESS